MVYFGCGFRCRMCIHEKWMDLDMGRMSPEYLNIGHTDQNQLACAFYKTSQHAPNIICPHLVLHHEKTLLQGKGCNCSDLEANSTNHLGNILDLNLAARIPLRMCAHQTLMSCVCNLFNE